MKKMAYQLSKQLLVTVCCLVSAVVYAQSYEIKISELQASHSNTTGDLSGGWFTVQPDYGDAGSAAWYCFPDVVYIPNNGLETFYAAYATALNVKARDAVVEVTLEKYPWSVPPVFYGGMICEVKNMKLISTGS